MIVRAGRSCVLERDLGHPNQTPLDGRMIWLLPVSITLSALMSLYLASLKGEQRVAHIWLAASFGLLALMHALTGLAASGHSDQLHLVRPALAAAFPVLIFLHARALARPPGMPRRRDLFHLAGPAGLLALPWLDGLHTLPTGWLVDVALFAITVGYAITTFGLARKMAPPPLARWGVMLAGWLAATALGDAIIVFELARPIPLSGSVGLLISLAGLIGFFVYFLYCSLHQSGPIAWIRVRTRTPERGFPERLEAHMAAREPWRDAELSVARLARQIGCPQRQISETINARWNMSVSRWLATYRVAEAQRLMLETPKRPLVELMLDCGFQTRSNFNRAFKDITGQAPSDWRRSHEKGHS